MAHDSPEDLSKATEVSRVELIGCALFIVTFLVVMLIFTGAAFFAEEAPVEQKPCISKNELVTVYTPNQRWVNLGVVANSTHQLVCVDRDGKLHIFRGTYDLHEQSAPVSESSQADPPAEDFPPDELPGTVDSDHFLDLSPSRRVHTVLR